MLPQEILKWKLCTISWMPYCKQLIVDTKINFTVRDGSYNQTVSERWQKIIDQCREV
jgi:hypothetical protein